MRKEISLGESSLHIAMGPFGSSIKRSTFVDCGIPIISGQHLHGTKLDDSTGFNYISEQHASRHKNSIIHRGDVVFTAYGTLGQVSYVPSDSKYEKYIASQRQFFLRPNLEILDPRFLTYFFHTSFGKHLLLSNSSQVGVPSIASPTSFLRSLKITVPDLPLQKAIADILGVIEDKIELNNKNNKTLEDISKALFKSWFIDFDPVKAKSKGSSTGLPDEISELFPDSFIDSEYGEIPYGWTIDNLDKHLVLTKGRSYKSIELQESENALVTLKSFQRSGGYKDDGLKPYIGIFNEEQIINPGELIIALTDVTQEADVIGRPAIVRTNEKYKNLIASLDVGIIRKTEKGLLNQAYAYELLRTKKYVSHALSYTSGTTVLHLAKDVLKSFLTPIPSIEIIKIFTSFSSDIQKKIDINSQQSKHLHKIREVILPRLISGELKITNAEKMIDEVEI